MPFTDSIKAALKPALQISAVNYPILIIMTLVMGYDNFPVEVPMGQFYFMPFLMGGFVPALLGSMVLRWMQNKWQDKAMTYFSILAIILAILETIPNGMNNLTSDLFLVAAVLHFSTAIAGIYFIPKAVAAQE